MTNPIEWYEVIEPQDAVFMYQAALYCEACGLDIRKKLIEEGKGPADPDDENSYDSDEFPKGPYPDGGGNADGPHHCDAHDDCLRAITLPNGDRIGAWLGDELTEEGFNSLVTMIIDDLTRGDDHARQVGRMWRYLYRAPLEDCYEGFEEHKGAIRRNTVLEDLNASISEGERGIINRVYLDLDHVYAIGWQNAHSKEPLLCVWRMIAQPDGNFSEIETVCLPASESEERTPEDILREMIEEDAWAM